MTFKYQLHINYIIFLAIYILAFYMIYRKVQDTVVNVHMVNRDKFDFIQSNVTMIILCDFYVLTTADKFYNKNYQRQIFS